MNQNCIATHESNGLDIITALLLTDINPLGSSRMDLVLELKNNASKLLLAVMESRGDSENAERILYNMNPKQLVDVACQVLDFFKMFNVNSFIVESFSIHGSLKNPLNWPIIFYITGESIEIY